MTEDARIVEAGAEEVERAFATLREAREDAVAAAVAKELGVDDYAGLNVKGKIVVARRFTSEEAPFTKEEDKRRYGDLRHKAWTAREAGATVLDGLDVLVAQGAASFELWTGAPAPVEVMRAAVRSAA